MHLLGQPTGPWCDECSALVVCNCGECACRSCAAQIEIGGDRVSWAKWREFPPEEARLGELLKPMTFERAQYMEELQRVSEEYRRIESAHA